MMGVQILPNLKLVLMLKKHICMEEIGEDAGKYKLIKIDLTNLIVFTILLIVILLKIRF